MKVDTMRWIDYYVGIPLCFLGSVGHKLVSVIIKKKEYPLRNILFIELSEMGSAILVDPAMRKLKKETGVNIYFTIFQKNKPSLALLNTVSDENIYTIRENSILSFVIDTLGFFFWTRRKKIDAVIDLELFSRFTALLTGFCGAQKKAGFHAFFNEGLYRGSFLTHKVAYNPHMHIAHNFIALVNSLLACRKEVPYSKTLITDEEVLLTKVEITGAQKEAVAAIIRDNYPGFDSGRHKIILVNPNASELLIQRRWPPQYYVQLMKDILEYSPSALILVTGDPGERREAQKLKDQVQSDRCVNFAGKVSFAQLPLLYSISEFMVTNDSGPAHFAAVTDMTTFVIFGPETPALYGSLGRTRPIYAGLACSPCVSATNHRKTICRDNVCLQVIKPQLVLEIIKPDLEKINVSR
jgi:ADP-heptose:LPS heptosyltransferase